MSRVTVNPEMHEQVQTIFYLLYIQQIYSVADSSSSSSSVFGITILSVAYVCQTFNQNCVIFNDVLV